MLRLILFCVRMVGLFLMKLSIIVNSMISRLKPGGLKVQLKS